MENINGGEHLFYRSWNWLFVSLKKKTGHQRENVGDLGLLKKSIEKSENGENSSFPFQNSHRLKGMGVCFAKIM